MKDMNKRKRGISLIVLVITILVMIILAGVVVVSLQKNNPIEKAKEANFKTDVSSFASELGVGLSNSLVENSGVKPEEIFANKFVDMKKYINSFSKKYENKLVIADGKLTYIGGDSKEEKWSEECGIEVFRGVNKPVLSEGMIPVKYENNSWVICSENDPSWYNYEQKLWANVMLSDGKYKDKNLVGTSVADADLGSMFVWIPRYAYSIKSYKTPASENGEGTTQKLNDITFLLGRENIDFKGVKYEKKYNPKTVAVGSSTPKIVHPAFSFDEEELPGFWMAKFEAIMNEESGHTNMHNNESCNITDVNKDMIKIVPGKPTWRYINIGNMFFNVKNMERNKNMYGITNADTHLVRNSEWGAVCYLTTSKYGVTPTIATGTIRLPNSTGSSGIGYYSGGGENDRYKVNVSQSTTGNVTGIYDMNGGAWEYTGAFHDNQNGRLLQYGGSMLFPNGEINPNYIKYFEKYDVAEREKNNKLHNTIWNAPKLDDTYGNRYRKELSLARFDLMSKNLGDGMYEITDSQYIAFLGKDTETSYTWLINENSTSAENGTTLHNRDFMLIGNIYYSFLLRGGSYTNGTCSGIFATCNNQGDPDPIDGFRPAITVK